MVVGITAAVGALVLFLGFLILRRSWQKDEAARHARRSRKRG